jgi:hypothetical protein
MSCHALLLTGSRAATISRTAWQRIASHQLHLSSRRNADAKEPANDRNVEPGWIVHARHTLRAILRECSYLPDPSSRTYLAQHALARFRVYRLRRGKKSEIPEFDRRLREQHHVAQKALNQLRRANEGELGALYKTLALTYGRVGRRRHVLMEPLLPKDGQRDKTQPATEGGVAITKSEEVQEPAIRHTPPTDPALVNAPEQSPTGRRRNMKPLPELTPQLRALVSSQLDACPPAISRKELPRSRTLKPQIPEFNAWMRPMPKVRVANMTRRWYAEVLDRVLAPLPLQEWNMLRDLATGKQKPSLPPPRRKAVVGEVQSSRSGISQDLKNLVLFNRIPRSPAPDRDAHTITHRFMRRLYAKVFSECPLMEWDSLRNTWKITWGHHAVVPGHSHLEASKVKRG